MSTLAIAPMLPDRVDGEPTLDDLLAGAWEGLSARRAVRCPVCVGEMAPVGGAVRTAGGCCKECGATLQ